MKKHVLGLCLVSFIGCGPSDTLDAQDEEVAYHQVSSELTDAGKASERPPETLATGGVKIVGVSLIGSGCPAGTTDIQVDATGTLFEASFSEFNIQTGPGTTASDWRRQCKLALNLKFEPGYQFATLDTTTRGYARIPAGAKGVMTHTFSFAGFRDETVYTLDIPSRHSGDFTMQSSPSLEAWSPCGGSTAILSLNTAGKIVTVHGTGLVEGVARER